MKLETFTYDLATRSWSVPSLPALDSPETLVLAFGAPETVAHPNVFQLLRDAYPSSYVMGCSSAGVIAGDAVLDGALSVAVARFERTTLASAAVLVRDVAGSRTAGMALARKLSRPGLRAILVLSEGIRLSGEDLAAGVASVVGDQVVVTGGMAGDGLRFERTWVSSANRLQSGLIAGLGLYGEHLVVGHGVQSGWEASGPAHAVTRAAGNVIHELDGRPALEVLRPRLGKYLAGLPATGRLFPVALQPPSSQAPGPDDVLVRNLLAVDDAGALIFAGNVPQGHRARLMRADADRLLHSAADAAVMASQMAGANGDMLGIAVSCVGRRIALGDRTGEELGAAGSMLPPGLRLAGFYGHGAIAPGAGGRARLYTQSLSITLLGESATGRGGDDAGFPDALAWDPDEATATVLPQAVATAEAEPDASAAGEGAREHAGDDADDRPGARGDTLEVTAFSRDLSESAWSVPVLPALDSPQTLVLVFGAAQARRHEGVFDELHRAYPSSHVLGCSTAGEIFGAEVRDRSVSVMVARFAHTALQRALVVVHDARDSFRAGGVLAGKLHRADLRAVLVLGDGLGVNGVELARGLRSVLGDQVTITGGLAGDGSRYERTWTLAGEQPESGAVVAVGFYGDHVIVGHGAAEGWEAMGPERRITRCEGRVIHELDGRPALDVYRETVGGRGAALVALRTDEGDGQRIWGTVAAVHQDAGAVSLSTVVPPGARVQLVRAEPARVGESAAAAARAAQGMAGSMGPVALGIAVSTVGRRMVLGEHAEQEIAAAAGVFSGLRLAGFYGYGTLAPVSAEHPALQAPAMTFTVIGESPQPRRASGGRAAAAGHGPGAAAAGVPGTQAARLLAMASPAGAPALVADEIADEAGPETGDAAGPEIGDEAGDFALATFTYDAGDAGAGAWSVPALPALDSPRTLILAFGAPALSGYPEVFSALREAYPRSHILGCSTAGEVAGLQVTDNILSVAVMRFAHTTLTSASVVVGDAAGSFPAGQVLAHKLDEPGLRAIVVLAEGLEISGNELLRGINSVVDPSVVVTGGMAGDGLRFERTWVLSGDKLQSSLVTAVGLYGEHLAIGHGAEGGWAPFGPEGTVTRSTGNVLLEMDGRPALAWYKEHLGDQAAGLPATGLLFPLALRGAGDALLVRTVLAIDDGQQSMTFAGDMPTGTRAHILCADFGQLVDGAARAAQVARDEVDDVDHLGERALHLVISDVGRRVVLGDGTAAEIEAAAAQLPEGVHTVGFYGYGGFSSSAAAGGCELHNQTLIVTVLGELDRPYTRPTSAAMGAHGSGKRKSASGEPARALAGRRAAGDDRARPVANLLPGSELSAYRRDVDGLAVIELAGRLNESFDGRALAASLSGTVVLDLARVERVTSFGVREWLHLMSDAAPRVDAMYLANCSEAMVNQLVMIRIMAGSAGIMSFAAPYVCRSCNHTFTHVLDCERDNAAIQAGSPPAVPCPRCGEAGMFDDDVGVYFSFAQAHAGRPVPGPVRRALSEAGRVPGTGDAIAEAIEKTVTEELTRIRINGVLDESIRWSRILEGIEGVMRLDLGGVTEVRPEGAALLQSALRAMAGSTERCELAHCPAALVELLAAARPPLAVTVVSAYVPAYCAACKLPRTVLVDVAGQREVLGQGQLPSLLCKRCSSELAFTGDRAMLRFLAEAGAGQAVAAVPVRRSRGRAWAGALGALMAACVLLGVGYGIWRGASWSAGAPGLGVVAGDGGVAPGDASGGASGDSSDAALRVDSDLVLPPPWVDREFAIEADEVLVVGRGGPAADVHGAIQAAYRDAVHRVLVAMVPRLRGAPVYGFLRTHQDPGEPGAEAAARIVTRYEQQLGRRGALERADAFPERRGDQVVVAGWYRMSRAGFDEAVAYYRRADTYLGMTVVPVFPLLAPRMGDGGDLVVVEVDSGSPAARAGVAPGDVIVRVGGRYVSSLEEYAKTIREAWDQTRRRRYLDLERIAGEERGEVRLKKR